MVDLDGHIYNPVIMLASLLAAAVAAGLSAAGFQSMAPTGQWFGRTFVGLGRGSKLLALTYDDGPNDVHTQRLMEVLARHDVRATFFLIGKYAQARPNIVRALATAGHVIGNHTYTHPNLIFAPSFTTRKELTDCEQILTEVVGEHSPLFRPPFGGRRPQSLRITRSLHLQPVMWNVTGWDWKAPPADYIERRVAKQVRGGDVILLHDGGHLQMGADRSQTVIATDRLIVRFKDAGYELVTVPEMMARQQSAPSNQHSAVE